jgi:hypothetical protein
VYVSIASQEMSDNHLQNLLNKARENNEQLAITGMLLYRDGFFIQALEGEQKAIEDLYTIISQDKRHKDLILIYEQPIENRRFPDWTMGFHTLNDEDVEDIRGYTDFLKQPTPESFSQYANQVDVFLDKFRH